MVKIFTDNNFESEVLQSKLPVIVDFYADWCAPCKLLSSVIEDISNEYEGKVKVGKLDIEENRAIWATYGVKSLPTVFFIKEGKVVQKVIGAVQKADLLEKINLVL